MTLSDLSIKSQLDQSIAIGDAFLAHAREATKHIPDNCLFDPSQPLSPDDEDFQNLWRQHVGIVQSREERRAKRHEINLQFLKDNRGKRLPMAQRVAKYGPDHPRVIGRRLTNTVCHLRRLIKNLAAQPNYNPKRLANLQQRLAKAEQERAANYEKIRALSHPLVRETHAHLPPLPQPSFTPPPFIDDAGLLNSTDDD